MLTVMTVKREGANLFDKLVVRRPKKIVCWKRQSLARLMDSVVKHMFPGCVPAKSRWDVYCGRKLIAHINYLKNIGYQCELISGDLMISSLRSREIVCRLVKEKRSSAPSYYRVG